MLLHFLKFPQPILTTISLEMRKIDIFWGAFKLRGYGVRDFSPRQFYTEFIEITIARFRFTIRYTPGL